MQAVDGLEIKTCKEESGHAQAPILGFQTRFLFKQEHEVPPITGRVVYFWEFLH